LKEENERRQKSVKQSEKEEWRGFIFVVHAKKDRKAQH